MENQISVEEKQQIKDVKQDAFSITRIKNPSERVQLAAIKTNVDVLGVIANPSAKVQLTAIRRSKLSIKYIQNPTKEAIVLYNRMYGKEAQIKHQRDKYNRERRDV